MVAKFVLKKGSTGKYHFNLVATNGQVIATSESYESKTTFMQRRSRLAATPRIKPWPSARGRDRPPEASSAMTGRGDKRREASMFTSGGPR